MSDERVPTGRKRRRSKAQFRCTVCKRFVVATEYGVCPHCGLGPAEPPTIGTDTDPLAWRTARERARQLGVGPGYWLSVALIAIIIAVSGALLAVC